jgi:hypothetical protein
MKKLIGIILILSAVALLGIIIYSKVIAEENDLTWFSLILPVLFIYQGLTYLKPPIQITNIVVNEANVAVNESDEPSFDPIKRNKIITKLKNMSGVPLLPINEFLDGNLNDLGSIGCNLYPTHPGINVFRSVFQSFLGRKDVSAIYAHISEIEPDEDSWPYTDRVYVFGTISSEELEQLSKQIKPTEIGEPGNFFSKIPKEIISLSSDPLRVLWWD